MQHLLTFEDLRPQKNIQYSRQHLRRMIKAGTFPKPVQLSPNRVAWLAFEIDNWIDQRAAAREVAA